MTDPVQPSPDPDAAAAPSASPEAREQGAVAAEREAVSTGDRVSVRRAPRYPRFIVLGAGLGAIVTFVLTASFPIDESVGFGPLFGYFLLFGVPAGAALGGIVAVVLDVIATRRAKQFDAERTTVDAEPEELEGELED